MSRKLETLLDETKGTRQCMRNLAGADIVKEGELISVLTFRNQFRPLFSVDLIYIFFHQLGGGGKFIQNGKETELAKRHTL